MALRLDGKTLTIEDVTRVAHGNEKVTISPRVLSAMKRFRSVLERRIERGDLIYGVNTGFGALAYKAIPKQKIRKLQTNLIRSHSIGAGEPMPIETVRAAMLIRANCLLRGHSAVRPETAECMVEALNAAVTPHVPSFGSLGASGDLVPSAHMALALTGEGKGYFKGRLMGAREALRRAGLKPLRLHAKEGLSIINSTSFSAALACLSVSRAKVLLDSANSCVALTCEAIGACSQSFDERLLALRNVPGLAYIGRRINRMLHGSERIRKTPIPQDPYSVRCAPQIHGALKEALDFAERIATCEINAVTDNPIAMENGEMLHGGNFHAQPLAMSLDLLSIAVSYLAVLSVARTHLLLSKTGEENKFFASDPGLENGLMLSEYTAYSLLADNSHLYHPTSTYPASTAGGVEDHASFGVNSGLKAMKVGENVSRVLAAELLCLSSAVDAFGGKGMARHTKTVHNVVRGISPTLRNDRALHQELEEIASGVLKGDFVLRVAE